MIADVVGILYVASVGDAYMVHICPIYCPIVLIRRTVVVVTGFFVDARYGITGSLLLSWFTIVYAKTFGDDPDNYARYVVNCIHYVLDVIIAIVLNGVFTSLATIICTRKISRQKILA